MADGGREPAPTQLLADAVPCKANVRHATKWSNFLAPLCCTRKLTGIEMFLCSKLVVRLVRSSANCKVKQGTSSRNKVQ